MVKLMAWYSCLSTSIETTTKRSCPLEVHSGLQDELKSTISGTKNSKKRTIWNVYCSEPHFWEKKSTGWAGTYIQEFWFFKSILDQVLKPRFKAKILLPKTVIFYQKPDKSVGSLTGAVSLNLHWKGVISKFRPGRGRPRSLQLWVYFDYSIYYHNVCNYQRNSIHSNRSPMAIIRYSYC